jgi:hypothetical protein
MCPGESTASGTTWHSLQASGRLAAPPSRCAWCAPTPTALTAVLPDVSTGGAGSSPLPWQPTQPVPGDCTLPSTWSSGRTKRRSASITSPWHAAHCSEGGCGGGGGSAWQEPHACSDVRGAVHTAPASRWHQLSAQRCAGGS